MEAGFEYSVFPFNWGYTARVIQQGLGKKPCLQHGVGGQCARNGAQAARPQQLQLRREEGVQPAFELQPQAHLAAPMEPLQLTQVLQATAQQHMNTDVIAKTGHAASSSSAAFHIDKSRIPVQR